MELHYRLLGSLPCLSQAITCARIHDNQLHRARMHIYVCNCSCAHSTYAYAHAHAEMCTPGSGLHISTRPLQSVAVRKAV